MSSLLLFTNLFYKKNYIYTDVKTNFFTLEYFLFPSTSSGNGAVVEPVEMSDRVGLEPASSFHIDCVEKNGFFTAFRMIDGRQIYIQGNALSIRRICVSGFPRLRE
jgi:hypothetical protein